jgi:hypothetical protein
MDKEPTLFVGVDWASKEHQVCIIGGGAPQQRAFAHDAEQLPPVCYGAAAVAHTPRIQADRLSDSAGPLAAVGLWLDAFSPKPWRRALRIQARARFQRHRCVLAQPIG